MCLKFMNYVRRLVLLRIMYFFEVIKLVATNTNMFILFTQIIQTFMQTSIFICDILLHIEFWINCT